MNFEISWILTQSITCDDNDNIFGLCAFNLIPKIYIYIHVLREISFQFKLKGGETYHFNSSSKEEYIEIFQNISENYKLY